MIFIIGFCFFLGVLLYFTLSGSFHLTNEQKEQELEDIKKKTKEIENQTRAMKNKYKF